MNMDIDPICTYDSACKDTMYEYTYIFDTKPVYASIITGIKEKELPILKLKGSEKFQKFREKYVGKLKGVLIRALKHGLTVVFYHLKRSSRISFIFPQLMSFITSELKRTEKLKAPSFLKAVYYLLLNEEIWLDEKIREFRDEDFGLRKHVSSDIVCTSSLKTFLINLSKSCALRYLLKDLAADILSEMSNNFLSDNAIMLLSHDLKEILEDSYGGTIKWLLNVTPVTDAKLVHCELSTLTKKAFNSPRMFRRLLSVCESFVYCATPSRKKILFNLCHLLRYEAIFTALTSDVEYKESCSKIYHFSDLLFDHAMMTKLLNADKEIHQKTDERETNRRIVPVPYFFEADRDSSFMVESGSFWDYFSIQITIDLQLIFFGYFTPRENGVYDYLFRETESVCRVSTSPPYSDTNIKLIDQDVYDPFTFKISDGLILFQRRRCSKKRKFSAIS